MTRIFTVLGWLLVALLLGVGIFPEQVTRAQVSVLNYFDQAGSDGDNTLHIDGSLEFEGKATVIDHGTQALTGGQALVTTNLSSITGACVLTLLSADTPGDDPVELTGLWTSGSAAIEIFAWATDGSDPTLIASSSTDTVGYVCFGED